MPKGQYIDSIIRALMPIERNIARIAKLDDQLTQFRQLWKWATYFWAFFQSSELSLNRLGSSPSYLRTFLDKKLTTELQPLCSTFGDNYSWHLGSSASASVPQVLSQARVSWPVRCRPVS
ncbi:hypothetical protein ALQ37_01923 [Pseudomonas syringae pv. aptata]|uniref:Uncharacterized protein n=1 Tax=Pseudomonas syringae pv. aptata TaxID=83167 RepID=A0A0N8T895_PSEAP|nr:Unknown protein sequence [Pseudomonas syringae pv. aptata]RMO46221.1 hypothetical protein ALQ40_00386 [Pseudomonas syringae]RMO67205.1 hypothetical protein ALQ37_01923 [Pseudomonas syringae pv. aptata]